MITKTIHQIKILILPKEGPKHRAAHDLLSAAWEHEAAMVAIPAERLEESFFALASGVAGEFTQKFVNYQIRLAILGDISVYTEQSKALRDFVYESNRGKQLWFLRDEAALTERLSGP